MADAAHRIRTNWRDVMHKISGLVLADDAELPPTVATAIVEVTGAPAGAYWLAEYNVSVAIALRNDAPSDDAAVYLTTDQGVTWTAMDWGAVAVGSITLARGRIIRGSAAGVGEALDISAADTIAIGDGTDAVALVLPTTGIVAKTAAGAVAGRTLTDGGGVMITNGGGVAGNPMIEVTKAKDDGSVATASIIMSAQPADGDTLTIGADIYEFVDTGVNFVINNDAHIGVVIGALVANTRANLIAAINGVGTAGSVSSVTLADTVTPCIEDGTESVLADEIGNNVRIRGADGVGGSVIASDPDILLAEAITAAADVWDVGNVNMNTLAGAAEGHRQEAHASLTVTAAMITSGCRVDFPFTVVDFSVFPTSTTGVIRANGTDTFAVDNGGIAIVFGGGVAPDVQATDILHIRAWSAAT